MDLFIFGLNARLQRALPCHQVCILLCNLVRLLRLLLVLVELKLKHFDLLVFVLYHLLLALQFYVDLRGLFCLCLGNFQLLDELVVLLFRSHQCHLQIILRLSFLVEDIFLLV